MTTAKNQTTVSLAELKRLSMTALLVLGLEKEEARIVQDVLLYAELRGSAQGLIKIKERTIVPSEDKKPLEVQRRTPVVSHIKANGQLGMVVMTQATQLAIASAKEYGISLVTTVGTNTSTGAIGYYAEQIAKAGHIGVIMAGSPKSMAIHGGIDPVFGTNPIAIAVPYLGKSIVLDMATASTTWFGLIKARDNNEPISPGLAYDADGNETTIPADALAGAIKTFGGAKGSGLALMLELLSGPLTGATLFGDEGDSRGNIVIAINPKTIGDQNEFEQKVHVLLERIRGSRAKDNTAPIRLPGEHSRLKADSVIKNGKISVDTDLYQHLQTLAVSTS